MPNVEIYIYGLHPKEKGSGVYTYSNSENKDAYKSIIQKLVKLVENPAETDGEERIFYKWENKAIYSYIFSGRDSANRSGITSYNLFLDWNDFKEERIDPIAFEECISLLKESGFGVRYPKGKIRSFTLEGSGDERKVRIGNEEKRIIVFRDPRGVAEESEALKRILSLLLGGEKVWVNLGTKVSNGFKPAEIAYELFSFLPAGMRDISFITSPEDGGRFDLVFSESRPRTDEWRIVNFSKSTEFVPRNFMDELAGYIVDAYLKEEKDGLIATHKEWKKYKSKAQSNEKAARRFYMEKVDRKEADLKKVVEIAKGYLPDEKNKFLKTVDERMKDSNNRESVGSILLEEFWNSELLKSDLSQFPRVKKWLFSKLLRDKKARRDFLEKSEIYLDRGKDTEEVLEYILTILKNVAEIKKGERLEAFSKFSIIYLRGMEKMEEFGTGIKEVRAIKEKCGFSKDEWCNLLEKINKGTKFDHGEEIASQSGGPVRFLFRRYIDILDEGGMRGRLHVSDEEKGESIHQMLRNLAKYSGEVSGEDREEAMGFVKKTLDSIENQFKDKVLDSLRGKEVRDSYAFRFLRFDILIPLLYVMKKYDQDYEDELREKVDVLVDNLFSLGEGQLESLVRAEQPDFIDDLKESKPLYSRRREYIKRVHEKRIGNLLNAGKGRREGELLRMLWSLAVAEPAEKVSEKGKKEIRDFINKTLVLLEDQFKTSGKLRRSKEVENSKVFRFLRFDILIPLLYVMKKYDQDYEDELREKVDVLVDNLFSLDKSGLSSIFNTLKLGKIQRKTK